MCKEGEESREKVVTSATIITERGMRDKASKVPSPKTIGVK